MEKPTRQSVSGGSGNRNDSLLANYKQLDADYKRAREALEEFFNEALRGQSEGITFFKTNEADDSGEVRQRINWRKL